MWSSLRRLWRDESGADIPEYALLVALIAIGILAAIYTYGLANSNTFGGAANGLNSAAPVAGQSSGGSAGGGQGGGDSGSGHGAQSGGGGTGGSQGGDGGGQAGSGQGGQGGQGGSAGGLPTNPVPLKPPQSGSGGGSNQ